MVNRIVWYIPKNLCISSGLSSLLAYIVCRSISWSFVFLCCQCNSPSYFLIVLIWALFSPWLIRLNVYQFCWSFKEPAFAFIDFSIVFFIYISFIYAQIFMTYFLLLTSSFVFSSFSIVLGIRWSCLWFFFFPVINQKLVLWKDQENW